MIQLRGKNTLGRFTIPFELAAVSVGLEQDKQMPLEQHVDWWRWDYGDTRIDPTYDVGDYDGGRVWHDPVRLMVMAQNVEQGPLIPNERGYYTSDQMSFIVNESEWFAKMPDIAYVPDPYLRDRITWRGKVFRPTQVNPRAHLVNTAVTVLVRAEQVNPEELVNDPQFNWYTTMSPGPFTREFTREFKGMEVHGTDVTHTVNEPADKADAVWLPPPDDTYGG